MKIYTCDQYIEGLKKRGIVVFAQLEQRIRELNPNGVPSGCFAETDGLIPEHDLRYAAGYGADEEPMQGVQGLSVKTARFEDRDIEDRDKTRERLAMRFGNDTCGDPLYAAQTAAANPVQVDLQDSSVKVNLLQKNSEPVYAWANSSQQQNTDWLQQQVNTQQLFQNQINMAGSFPGTPFPSLELSKKELLLLIEAHGLYSWGIEALMDLAKKLKALR